MLNGKKKNVSHQEEKYQFIREQIRPQRKKKILVWLGRFIMIAAMACIFGMIAGTIILYMQKQSPMFFIRRPLFLRLIRLTYSLMKLGKLK